MNYNAILKIIPEYVVGYVQSKNYEIQLPFHNMHHTEKVLQSAKQIASHYQLNEQDYFVVVTAAWFHDLGYYSGESINHEDKGAIIAEAFLKSNSVKSEIISEVKDCILATKMPQNPLTLNQKIICDADLFHFGTEEFTELNKKVRKEHELSLNQKIDKNEWRAETIKLLQNHHYQTDFCQLLLNETKQKNLEKLIHKNKEAKREEVVNNEKVSLDIENVTLKTLEIKTEKPGRGVETMFRVASTNHQRLSDMADSKAHIMISVNSIILSVVIGLVAGKLDSVEHILLPTLILILGSLVAIIFSVLATRPKIPGGYFTNEQVENKTANLLFFGNFYNMGFDQYYEGMKKVMSDSEYLYGSLIRDIYSEGIILGSKYKLLRLSYTIFMFTLVVSVLAFGVTFIFFNK